MADPLAGPEPAAGSGGDAASAPTGATPTPPSDPRWRAMLEGTAGGFASGRGFLRMIPSDPRCKLCAAPFSGPGAPVMRWFDRGPWEKSPSICGFCFKQLERARGGAEITLTLLFADVRGSTTLAETMGAGEFRRLLDRFYHEATRVLLAHDAVIDKYVGDEVVALFIPALTGAAHPSAAIAASQELLRATGHGDPNGAAPWLPLGVGIHTGEAYVGTVGDTVTDFTALGDSVNVTARLASAAGPGEILISAVTAEAADLDPSLETRNLTLRGRLQPLDVRVLRG
ncbi:MAG TPA: adenylate/guanylate cyclase domain-containing protein [Candidatus Limnocylindrales bacterium]|nr:adenylate/guanylate cyclase domain-containing protein [Candidatus Limnocylindrales bacterium]